MMFFVYMPYSPQCGVPLSFQLNWTNNKSSFCATIEYNLVHNNTKILFLIYEISEFFKNNIV